MAKNKKGNDKAEYPKLIRIEGVKGKVRVLSEADEDAARKAAEPAKTETKKAAGWDKDK